MKKTFLTLMLFAGVSIGIQADDLQTVTVNGTATDKQVKHITLTGDRLHLTFADQTEADCNLKALNINFKEETGAGIDETAAAKREAGQQADAVYNMNGQRTRADHTVKGIYIVGGKKQVVK